MTSNSANFSFNCRVSIRLYIFVSTKISSLHQKSNHIFSRTIIKGIFFPNTTTQQQKLHITTPTTNNPTIRKIRIVNMSVLFECNFSFPFIPLSYQNVTSPLSLPKPLSFLAPPPIRSKFASKATYSNSKRHKSHKNQTKKQANKENKIHIHTKRKTNPSKRHPKTIHQIHPTRKYTHPNSHPNPLNTTSNPPQKPYTPKRKCISPQTPKRLLPNARTFHLKRKYV